MRVETRAPRLQVLANGVALPGVVAADVWSNNHLAADRFRVRLASQAGVLDIVDAQGVRFEVQFGVDGDWSSLVEGEADCVLLDPLRGLIDVEGRDLAALFIDTRVDETFENRTSSEIAGILAGRHGLGVVATPTQTLVGRYYQAGHDRLTMGQFARAMSEWDLLAYLAGQEGFDLFMSADALQFMPRSVSVPITILPEDCEAISLEHAMGMSRAIEVTVRSWDQRSAQSVSQTVTSNGSGRNWKHSIVRPNLPPDEAQRLAEQVLADLLRHERTVSIAMPGDVTTTPRQGVVLAGTGTAWDGSYAIAEVSRHLDVRRGFTQRLCLQGGG